MKILCAVDGSEFSQWAVEALGALDRSRLESITLLHVVDTHKLKLMGSPRVVSYRGARVALEKAGTELLKRANHQADVVLSQSALRPRTKIRTVMLAGSPAATIARYAAQERSHLIVLGTRGLSDVKGFLLGSVARKVASLAPCPALVVKQPLHTLNRVLLAVDDSKYSRAAARFLRSGILPETAAITICTSAETPVTDLASHYLSDKQLEELKRPVLERATDLVTEIREEFIKNNYTVTTEVRMNHVIDTILKLATANHSDLLVVGSRGLTGTERLQLGSVSESLLKYAPCSVLIVRGVRA
jgi:nucleotide-binding universal stress UspA family protein